MHVKASEVVLVNSQKKFLRATTEETLQFVKKLKFTNEIKIIPLKFKTQSHFLGAFKTNANNYLYMAGQTSYYENITIIMLKLAGIWKLVAIQKIEMYNLGATMEINLDPSCGFRQIRVSSPPPFKEDIVYLEENNGNKIYLDEIEIKNFNFKSIDLTVDTNIYPRPTPLDLCERYTQRAVAGLFFNKLPVEIGYLIGSFLDAKTGYKVAMTCKTAYRKATEENTTPLLKS